MAMRKEDIEENLRMRENLKEFERLKKLAEIEERNKKIENIKKQKLKIFEERRRMNKTLDNEKEYLLIKFNALMSQKKKSSKEEIMNKLFNEDIHSATRYKSMGKNKSCIDVSKTAQIERNKKAEEVKEQGDDEYNDFEKKDNFFVTNLNKQI